MAAPPLLLGSALLFWGAQTGHLPLACAAAAALEANALLAWRWNLAPAQLNRISDLCALLFGCIVVYSYSTKDAAEAIMQVTQWVPIAVWPLAAAQSYGTPGRIDLGAFFLYLRRADTGGEPRPAIDVNYPYFILCVLCASAANVRTPFFYQGMVVLCGAALWKARPAGRSVLPWSAALCLAVLLGFVGHQGLHSLQKVLENLATDVLFGKATSSENPYLSSTAMGRIGALKQSDEIVLRVSSLGGLPPPPLLRQAAFSRYNAGQWQAQDGSFMAVSWPAAAAAAPRSVKVSAYFSGGSGVLALPPGTLRLDGVASSSLSRNRFGAVRLETPDPAVDYEAGFDPASSGDSLPDARDLALPARESPLLRALARERRLSWAQPRRAMAGVAAFFEKGFRYSLYQKSSSAAPLEDFLLRTRKGHCEFFATATVLLLRAADIPARYATGYAVTEWSRLEGAFVVRQRHAHAWALVYADGAWRDLDTTPSVWAAEEAAQVSSWRWARDLGAWTSHRFGRWRRAPGWPAGRKALLLLPLLALLAWKLSRGLWSVPLRLRRPGAPRPRPETAPGLDSELYLVEARLARAGLGRRPGEPMSLWAARVGEGLPALAALHDRYRFSRSGLGPRERAALKAESESWLTLHP